MDYQNKPLDRHSPWRWAVSLWIIQLLGLLAAGLVIQLFLQTPRPAYAQGSTLTTTHSTLADWQGCTVAITNTTIANANGGELRLAATVEDYFEGTTIDATRWYSNISDPVAGGSPATSISGGILTLDGTYLLSTAAITQVPRFYEARARLVQTLGTSGRPDVGYWRHGTLGPRYTPDENAGGSRVFILGDPNTSAANDLFTGSRDGATVILNNIGDPDNSQYHLWRVEWESAQARYYIDDVLTDTAIINTNVITGWAFLYHQSPSNPYGTTPLTVDWVRAGQYPSSGEFVSCAIDGRGANWNTLSWTSTVPGSTGMVMSTRSSPNGSTWGAWTSQGSTSPVSITSESNTRYLQYRVEMSSSTVLASPEAQSISITRLTTPTAVTLTDLQARAEPWNDWRWLLAVAAGVIVFGALGARTRRR
ncbi:MAG: hypothetical protein HY868_09625 [Chloroflexi bacterium]|nr:hypothetical protein [Chloroflexota bacterium]